MTDRAIDMTEMTDIYKNHWWYYGKIFYTFAVSLIQIDLIFVCIIMFSSLHNSVACLGSLQIGGPCKYKYKNTITGK